MKSGNASLFTRGRESCELGGYVLEESRWGSQGVPTQRRSPSKENSPRDLAGPHVLLPTPKGSAP